MAAAKWVREKNICGQTRTSVGKSLGEVSGHCLRLSVSLVGPCHALLGGISNRYNRGGESHQPPVYHLLVGVE